jgi:phage terminase large subunit-like protein
MVSPRARTDAGTRAEALDLVRTPADERAVKLGMRFDAERAAFTCDWIEEYCCLYEGDKAGEPLALSPYQRDFFGRLYGWVRWSDEWGQWIRRYTHGAFWAAKKNGKSPMAAAHNLYLLAGDGERGQKVYMMAGDGQQARISQMHSVMMVKQSPALWSENGGDCKINNTTLEITHLPTNSVIRIVTGDDSRQARAKEGYNGSVTIDECFVAGTPVSTPGGTIAIDKVRPGDVVLCATGSGTVLGVSRRQVTELFEVEFADGVTLTCTANHRIFTDRGWVAAGSLGHGAIAYGPEAVRAMWRAVRPMADATAAGEEVGSGDAGAGVERAAVLLGVLLEEAEEPRAVSGDAGEDQREVQGDRASAQGARGERAGGDCPASRSLAAARGGLGSGGGGSRGPRTRERMADALQDRRRQRGPEDCDRGGRPVALCGESAGAGRQEECVFGGVGVVRVSRVQRDRPCDVFNLHVAGHPSYFAHGRLVHNCHVVNRTMMESVARAGISRKEPLQVSFSTAGDDPSSYGAERFRYGRQVDSGERDDPHFLHVEYGIPETATEADVEKNLDRFGQMANPAWGELVKPSEFRADWTRSKGSQREMAKFLQHRLNRWVGSTHRWLNLSAWEAAGEPFTLADLAGRDCFAALDLSRTRDMTAFVLTFPMPEIGPEVVRLWPMFWLPRETALERDHLFPLMSWAGGDYLTLTGGGVVDYALVKADIRAAITGYGLNVLNLYFDPHYANEITQQLHEGEQLGGASVPGVVGERTAFQQGLMTFTGPSKEFERRVSAGLVRHPNNPVMTWQVGHAEVWSDRNRNIRPVKPETNTGKSVDGVVAGVMTFAGLMVAAPDNTISPRLLVI